MGLYVLRDTALQRPRLRACQRRWQHRRRQTEAAQSLAGLKTTVGLLVRPWLVQHDCGGRILPPLLMRHAPPALADVAPRLPLPEVMNNSFAAQMPLPVMTTGRFIRVRIAWSLLATIHTDDQLCGSCKGHPSVVVAVPAGEPRMCEQLIHSEYIAHHDQLWTLLMLKYGVGTAAPHFKHIQSLWE